MKRRSFGQTGLEVSVLGFGAAPVGYLGETAKRTAEILNLLLDQGMNLIDTAACYTNSEPLIAEAVGHRRDEYFLVTKCGHRAGELTGREWSSRLIQQSVERSLRQLQTDYLDVVVLHSCEETVLRQGEALETLVRARDEGKIRFVGYSGDNEAAAYAATLGDVAVIETSVNLCDQANIETVLPVAREQEVGVLAKRSVANAAWKDIEEQRGIYRDYSEPYITRLPALGITPSSLGFGQDTSEDWLRLALRFTLSVSGVDCAIVGTTSPENARVNLAAIQEGPLPNDMFEHIRESFRLARSSSDFSWEGLS
jgi:aryl-alcohol dehydrogenase-like predicted oxidoreductase